MNEFCPQCGAPLQPEARFCPHCMTSLYQKTELPTPKPPKKATALLPAIALVAVALLLGGVFALSPRFKETDRGESASTATITATAAADHSPLCTIEQFREAASLAGHEMGLDDVWAPQTLIDTHYSEKMKIRQYVADTTLGDALFSLFFYNDGEEIYAHICDVTPENRDKAESILKCTAQCVCNHYFTDIDQAFDDEKRYPKTELDVPFDPMYTDLLQRTDDYNAAIAAGTDISTRYIAMQSSEQMIVFVVTTRDTDGDVLYDMAVEIERLLQ